MAQVYASASPVPPRKIEVITLTHECGPIELLHSIEQILHLILAKRPRKVCPQDGVSSHPGWEDGVAGRRPMVGGCWEVVGRLLGWLTTPAILYLLSVISECRVGTLRVLGGCWEIRKAL
jgi:hypothetical protein